MASRVLTVIYAQQRRSTLEGLRVAVVCACALALIGAERVLPAINF